jgi:glutaredoxin
MAEEPEMMSLLSRWVRPRPKLNVAHLVVTVYTRSQCCCCHKAIDLIREYQGKHGFTVETVDIDADPELARRYDTTVPVVAIAGKVRFKGVVNPVLFERLLVAESRGR